MLHRIDLRILARLDTWFALGLALGIPSTIVRAAEPEVEVTEEQLAYSKKLYGEGVAAMEAKDYELAFEKFSEAYEYAPHLHAFNYNLAAALEGQDQCGPAQAYYRAFLNLVKSHPERANVAARLQQLQRDCPYDPESEAVVTAEDRERRDQQRERERATRAMNAALRQQLRAYKLYAAAQRKFPAQKAFKGAARRRRADARRLKKLLMFHSVPVEQRELGELDPGDGATRACRLGRSQEKRSSDALRVIFKYFDTKDVDRVVSRLMRRSETDQLKFDECAR